MKLYHHSPAVVQVIIHAPKGTKYMQFELGDRHAHLDSRLVGQGELDFSGHHAFFTSRNAEIMFTYGDDTVLVDTREALGDGAIILNCEIGYDTDDSKADGGEASAVSGVPSGDLPAEPAVCGHPV